MALTGTFHYEIYRRAAFYLHNLNIQLKARPSYSSESGQLLQRLYCNRIPRNLEIQFCGKDAYIFTAVDLSGKEFLLTSAVQLSLDWIAGSLTHKLPEVLFFTVFYRTSTRLRYREGTLMSGKGIVCSDVRLAGLNPPVVFT
ncbi:hypothetical protein LENED_000788 [Lentinula edodes]|uniref:Uncharacterized protein n=1 Tax=Lentinula edodes TaxID=5353 RepID=A0A1Q3DWG1_LENED|nr:hypothetical protein LENED_000788 [Lentinula edodes]